MRARTHRHARRARLIGRRIAGLDAVVLDAPERIAYCVAGRPHTIVVSRGALTALGERELDAVLARERAHLAGRHHLVLGAVRGLAAALPRISLFATGAAEIARLLEMCADDTAARHHGSRALLGGLLASPERNPAPTEALGATGIDVLARADRLAAASPSARGARTGAPLAAATALIALGPVTLALLYHAGVVMCGPMVMGV
ncbi:MULTISPECIES: M56 family metallopeptidase [Rhodococcus]|nr:MULTISPECIES: M56 family metallopeptidase [Rhodococcus]MDV7246576.1 M56 family metallopeptidase [Rhodococcus oxybenzonivorans]MDV7337588.1 M56 family metallopeptidase [Rhodococcus oxybenzonivorans]MDV8031402.1 M56 family metallopeptidase [Rhodococcus sp. IEGM 27]